MKHVMAVMIVFCAVAFAVDKPKQVTGGGGATAQVQTVKSEPVIVLADQLCCGCTAYINNTCVGYHCGLCPLERPERVLDENVISLLTDELEGFARPRCKVAGQKGLF